MISYLKGTIKYQASNWLILEVGGVGYKVFTNSKLQTLNSKQIQNSNNQNSKRLENLNLENLKIVSDLEFRTSDLIEMFTFHHIREDRQELYGFATMEELQMFELLIGVNGVGPKMAMNIMSQILTEKIRQAIENSDSAIFSSISGVGKKIAMKIILELKSKLKTGDITNIGDFDQSSQELLDALESLGYKKYEVTPLLSKIPHELATVEEKVKWILKQKK